MAHIRTVVAQFDVEPTAHIAVEDYDTDGDRGVIVTFADELAIYVDDETAGRLLQALLDGCLRLSMRHMDGILNGVRRRISEAYTSTMGQRARLDPGPLA